MVNPDALQGSGQVLDVGLVVGQFGVERIGELLRILSVQQWRPSPRIDFKDLLSDGCLPRETWWSVPRSRASFAAAR
jgi:hypothetical protein